MDQLHLALVSKDLKFSLSNQKIKTLQKAYEQRNNLTDQVKKEKVRKVCQQYEQIKLKVHNALSRQNDNFMKKESEENLKIKEQLYRLIYKPSIVQIYGSKCTAKSILLFHLVVKYTSMKNQTSHIINCGGGMTINRMNILNQNTIYSDAFTLQDVLSVVINLKKEVGLLAIDSITNLLMATQKWRLVICQLFQQLQQLKTKGWSIIFTNYTQIEIEWHKVHSKNPISYYSHIHNECVTLKMHIDRVKVTNQDPEQFLITAVKGANFRYQFKIDGNNITQLHKLQ